MAANTVSDTITTLTDLPGIGPTKAGWLNEAGIRTLDDLRDTPIETLAHVRGIGHVLAYQLKRYLEERPSVPDAPLDADEEEEADETLQTEQAEPEGVAAATQERWQEELSALQSRIEQCIGVLMSAPKRYGLKPKFLRDLGRLGKAVAEIPLHQPPDVQKPMSKIAKHIRTISTLLDSALKMDESSTTYQKVVRRKLNDRRKKLGKWV